MPDQEQRVKRAARVLLNYRYAGLTGVASRDIARRMLEAADREPPKWPSDEVMQAVQIWWQQPWVEADREELGRILREHDPIVKAAVRQAESIRNRNAALDGPLPMWAAPLFQAVNEAGL